MKKFSSNKVLLQPRRIHKSRFFSLSYNNHNPDSLCNQTTLNYSANHLLFLIYKMQNLHYMRKLTSQKPKLGHHADQRIANAMIQQR